MNRELSVVLLDAATFGDASLAKLKDWACDIYPFSRPETVPARLSGHEVAVVNKIVLDGPILNSGAAENLKLIAVAATGVDNVDLDAARARGIAVCNVPGYATQAVAQFTIALILEFATRGGSYASLVRRGAWERSPIFTLLEYSSTELVGKRLGIIGYGKIGQSVAKAAQSLGLDVSVSARVGIKGPPAPGRIAFEELLRISDYITLHCPLTDATKNLIDARALALVKPGAFLINTARGGLIDDTELLAALREGRLAGAALDVLTQEPPPDHHPLLAAARNMENLIITPHCAWATREARARLITGVAESIAAYARGEWENRVV